MNMTRRMKITRGGQISLPAPIRHRWGTGAVVLDDHGDHVTLRPASNHPADDLLGAFADAPGPSSEEIRRQEREADLLIERAKWRRYYGE